MTDTRRRTELDEILPLLRGKRCRPDGEHDKGSRKPAAGRSVGRFAWLK